MHCVDDRPSTCTLKQPSAAVSIFLFATHPAIGHINPHLAIAKELRRRGNTVVFTVSAPGKAAGTIVAEGFRLEAVRPSLRTLSLLLLPLTSGFTETYVALKGMSGGMQHYAKAIGNLIAALSPDVVVGDFAFPGAHLAAESRRVPYAAVYLAGLGFKGPGIPPFGSGLPIGEDWGGVGERYRRMFDRLERGIIAAAVRARKKLGLLEGEPPRGIFSAPASPWLNLVLTAEVCEAPRDPLPDTTFFVGPCTRSGDGGRADFPFAHLSAGLPKVYASLGTVFNNKPGVFRGIIDACSGGHCQLIVSAGRALGKVGGASAAPHLIVVEYAPQTTLLPHVDAVISHGGNNTVNETLVAGKPLLVLPVGGEQGDNASRVVYLGAGLRADPRTAGAEEIRAKIDRLLTEPAFRRRAAQISQGLARTGGPAAAAVLLDRLAATRAPIRRPSGYPLTMTRDLPPPWA